MDNNKTVTEGAADWAELDCVNALRRLVRAARNAANWGGAWDGERGAEERAALCEAEERLTYYSCHGRERDNIDWED